MTLLTARRTCPFCGTGFRLGDLPVVALNTRYPDDEDGDEDDDRRRLYPRSGRKVERWIGKHPVLAEPQIQPDRKVAQRLVDEMLGKSLTPLTSIAVPADMPARLCANCRNPLPVDIDDRDPLIVAVVGTSGSGKTHLLASMLHEAANNHAFRNVQCEEFAPDEASAELFDESYYGPVFIDRERLDQTHEKTGKRLLTYRVTFAGKEPYLLLFYDIAGETLSKLKERVVHADYLSRASGVLFLIDPVCLNPPPGREWRPAQHADGIQRRNQANLLNACINLIPPDRQGEVPFAIAVSKADLISEYLTWRPDVDQDREVRALLEMCNAHDVLGATGLLGPDMVSFHALAAIGESPTEDGELKVIEPFRCLDPLWEVLRRIPDATADEEQ
jgi:hypothetical protein